MKIFAFDTETTLIRPGELAPRMACVTWADGTGASGIHHVKQSRKFAEELLEPGTLIIGANTAYDTAVIAVQFPDLLKLIFEKYARGEVLDVELNQKLIDIASGTLGGYTEGSDENGEDGARHNYGYSLSDLHDRYGFGALEKTEWRLRFGEFIDTPIERWPAGAIAYAELDAVATMRVHLAQQEWHQWLIDGPAQARAAFALHLMSCRGIRTDGEACRVLADECEREIERCRDLCSQPTVWQTDKKGVQHITGLVRADGSKNMRAAQELIRAFGTIKVTKTGIEKGFTPETAPVQYTSVDYEACQDSGSPVLAAYATYTSANTLRKKVERLKFGAIGPLQTRYNPLVATGRTSSSAPGGSLVGDNFQNMGRAGLTTDLNHTLPGMRGCFVPRPGYVFCSVDLDNAEMRAMAQICVWKVGYSVLGDALNAGQDAHLALAAHKLGISYDEANARKKAGDKAVSEIRQFMKIPNFSLLGGASWKILGPYAKKNKPKPILITGLEAQEMYELFHGKWTEVSKYHRQIKQGMGGGLLSFEQFISGRVRGGCIYTVACNTGFQGLTADASKAALLPIQYECYCDTSSDLYGSYPLLYVHDEVIAEVPEERAHEAGHRLAELMIEPWNTIYTPDVPMTAAPALMRRLDKNAATVYDEHGRLQIWEPQKTTST